MNNFFDHILHPRKPHVWRSVGISLICLGFIGGVWRMETLIKDQKKDLVLSRKGFQRSEAAECQILRVIRIQLQATLALHHTKDELRRIKKFREAINGVKISGCVGPGGTFGTVEIKPKK